MSQRHSGFQRQADDVYETPPWVTHVLVPYLKDCRNILDPANGPASRIALSLRQKGFNITATARARAQRERASKTEAQPPSKGNGASRKSAPSPIPEGSLYCPAKETIDAVIFILLSISKTHP
jgi:hypothetical protein